MARGTAHTNPSGPSGQRDNPHIPDHEVLRRIGKGSFGEVWLARAVTGVYRAVKVIWRDDFEHTRDFEREFEAIKRYEPLSRQHPGLVDVLQVGRVEEKSYYYYIMEVADALEEGSEIDPDTYTPHTFRTEMLEKERLPLTACVELGCQLAEALDFLHEQDLIHRDVKLSNVIVVNGQAKLADIGLVAALGDRSFVGTEGYVPPEGAGTASADIFSLGMVIYEMATGKDRLDFPDVPTDFREQTNPELWRRINQVVCKACDRKVENRFVTAGEMARALRGEEVEERPKWPLMAGVVGAIAICALAFFAVFAGSDARGFQITTDPEGAMVYAGAEELGETPLYFDQRPKEGISFEIRKTGFRHAVVEYQGLTDPRDGLHLNLEPSKFPQPGAIWENSMGMEFKPGNQSHRLDFPVHADTYMEFAMERERFEGEIVMQEKDGKQIPVPIVPNRDARDFAAWLQAKDQAEGFIGPNYNYRAIAFTDDSIYWPNKRLQMGRTSIPITPFVVLVEKQRYGRLIITSEPSGAEVYERTGELLGGTPMEIPRVRTGPVEYEIRMEGYKPYYLEGVVEPDGLHELRAVLEAGQAIEFGKNWSNSLQMEFQPVGEDLLMATMETRVKDFRAYCDDTGAEFPQEGEATLESHPVDGMSRVDAEAFCEWLTDYERESGVLSERYEYRLPTDMEWSLAAGLPGERGATPAIRNGVIEGIYPWGYDWPPPQGSGNFADESLREFFESLTGEVTINAPGPSIIPDYNDGSPKLAWVNEFMPNRHGLYQMAGNVWEWVSDSYLGGGGAFQAGTIRGGSWQTSERRELLTSYRRSLAPTSREPGVGFRCVLARTTTAP